MTDESAKALADAMNRLAAAIESVRGNGLMPGIQVHHTGFPQQQYWPHYQSHYTPGNLPGYYPSTCSGGYAQTAGNGYNCGGGNG